jgi:tetratricopeptide (TPR) repeat protein
MNPISNRTRFHFMLMIVVAAISSCKLTNDELLEKGNRLVNAGKYDEAIAVYTKLIHRNKKFQVPYYNRGLCYYHKYDYNRALHDFNEAIRIKTSSGLVFAKNANAPWATEEDRMQAGYPDLLYMVAMSEYFMDSLTSSFHHFNQLSAMNSGELSTSLLFQGYIMLRTDDSTKACDYFSRSRNSAITIDQRRVVDSVFLVYCR